MKNSSATRHIRTYIYGDLVYKFKRIVGKPNFGDQFKKIVKRYIRVGYSLDIVRQSACLVLDPITVYSYGFLFNCTVIYVAENSPRKLQRTQDKLIQFCAEKYEGGFALYRMKFDLV